MSYQIKRKRKYKEKNKVNLNLQAMILLKKIIFVQNLSSWQRFHSKETQ